MKTIYSFLVVILILVVMGFESDAQRQIENPEMKGAIKSVELTIRPEGWLIPEGRRKIPVKKSSTLIDGVVLQREVLSVIKPIMNYEDFYICENNKLKVTTEKRKLQWIVALSVKGKTFAYEALYAPYLGPNSNVDAVFSVYFLDNDGDGKFEERIQSTKIPTVPAWIREL